MSQPHRLHAEDRRRQLLEAALNLFSRKGFEGTTTKEIAAGAGVTEAIIFRHFPTKQALYNAVLCYPHESGELDAEMARWKELMDANDHVGLFRAFIGCVIRGYRCDPRIHRAVLFAALEGHSTGLQQHRELSLPVFEVLCQFVARRQAAGAIRSGISSQAIVGSMAGAAAHFAMMTQFFGFQSPASDDDVVEAFLDIFLRGVLPAAPPAKAIA